MKDLLNPTPQQVKYRNRLWADALKRNKRKARYQMYDDCGGRCCLAVAQDVAIKCGLNVDPGSTYATPAFEVVQFFGWNPPGESVIPKLSLPNGFEDWASIMNDDSKYSVRIGSHGMSHKKVAECVLNTFVHPSNKKWTFKID